MKRLQADPKARQDSVTLLTGHKAKGLEWDRVIVVGVADGLVPHGLSKPGARVNSDMPVIIKPDLLAELNWLYVAISRGRYSTHVSGVTTHRGRVLQECSWMADAVRAGECEQVGKLPTFRELVNLLDLEKHDPDEVTEIENNSGRVTHVLAKYGPVLVLFNEGGGAPIAIRSETGMFVTQISGTVIPLNQICGTEMYKAMQ